MIFIFTDIEQLKMSNRRISGAISYCLCPFSVSGDGAEVVLTDVIFTNFAP